MPHREISSRKGGKGKTERMEQINAKIGLYLIENMQHDGVLAVLSLWGCTCPTAFFDPAAF